MVVECMIKAAKDLCVWNGCCLKRISWLISGLHCRDCYGCIGIGIGLSSVVGEFVHAGPFPNAGPEIAEEAFAERSDSPIEIPVVGVAVATVGRRGLGLPATLGVSGRWEFQETVPQAGIETSPIEWAFVRVLTAECVRRYRRALPR